MRHIMLCLVLLLTVSPAVAAAADEPPIHDCLEGGSMDMSPIEAATPAPEPSAGS